MALHLPTFYTRTLSAIVFVAVMLMGLLWNEASFTILIALIQFLCLREYFQLTGKIVPDHQPVPWIVVALQLLLIAVVGFRVSYVSQLLDASLRHKIMEVSVVLLPAILLLAATLSKKTAFVPLLIGLGSVVYIALPIVQLQYLYRQYHLFPLIIFAFLWINDTMAYIIGSFIGKHPLSPVSPKKTWEGTIGGIVLTIAVGAIAAHVWPLLPVNFMAIAGCAAIAGTFGDLLESKLKRMAGVKDSGTIMPGHGGALDRFDSLLLTVPVVCACYLLLH